jgi:pimeloyl-ACP methyl ester carboxylesterase
MDKLGQGSTGNPKTDADYTMAATVKHAAGLLQALRLKNVHVVGHSRGGYVVARMTLDYPELVRSCTIIDSGTLAPGPSKTEYITVNAPRPRLSRAASAGALNTTLSVPTTLAKPDSIAARISPNPPSIRKRSERWKTKA